MSLYKIKELLEYLERLGHRPSKRLSQNFLIDGNIVRKIAKTAEALNDDLIIEIGPGPGALTDALLDCGSTLFAIEKDTRLAEALAERLKNNQHFLGVATADVLDFPIEKSLATLLPEGKRAKVAANLPYSLTTPIIEKLLKEAHLYSALVLMVQDEVARRITAKPGTPEYGSLTLFINYWTTPSYAFKVSRRCFYPSPNVDSAVVVLKIREKPPKVCDEESLFTCIRASFSQRRKMVRNLLPGYSAEEVVTALETLGINPKCRGEELSLEQFIALSELLLKGGTPPRKELP